MEARLVTRRDGATLALFLSWFSAAFLGAVLADDMFRLDLIPLGPSIPGFVIVALAAAGGAIFPWLTVRASGAEVRVRIEEGAVHIGDEEPILAGELTGLSIAKAERGVSLALARGKRLVFLELERRADAARVAKALGIETSWFGSIAFPEASRLLAAMQAILALALLVAAPLYFMGTVGALPSGAKPLFGTICVVGALASALLLTVRRLVPNQALSMRRAVWDRHVALHEAEGRFAEHGKVEEAPESRGPSLLARGDESRAAWLARLDALPAERGAYRGEALKRDVLWETLGDTASPVDARVAAARILKRCHEAETGALVRVVADDPDVRVRVETAIDDDLDDEDVAIQLERLGPIFRAR